MTGENLLPAETIISVTEAVPSHSALDTLRERTRELHAQVEKAINISAALSSVPSYIRLLGRYLNIYTSFEAALQHQDARIHGIILQTYRSRVPFLERDLRALGAYPHPCRSASASIPLPQLREPDAVLGALYVVEGSNLGGQILYREIEQKLGIDEKSGAAFFFGNGQQTGLAWKRFTALLNQLVVDPDQAADAAAAMFHAFESALQPTEEDGQRYE